MALFLLSPSGSHGDVHPYLALAHALASRGHEVHFSISPHFEPLVRGAGFELDPVGTEGDFQAIVNDPGLWHPRHSLTVLFGGERFRRMMRENFEHLRKRYRKGQTVAVAGTLAVGARIAHESFGIPLATVHLQPMASPSATDPPRFPGLSPRPWWPAWLVRAFYRLGERVAVDPILLPPVNELRAELGLKPIRRVWGAWRHSPQCVLGLFPEWFGRARDWPPHLHCTGFVRYDQSDSQPLPPALEAFLNEGPPPVVISFGSAMRTGRAHFEAALAACSSLGLRSVLLARSGDQIPPLPKDAFHVDYAPFSLVFPRALVALHHGGVGTSAQALAAGVPQFVMPLAFDQFDNAERLVKLGVAKSLPAKSFKPTAAAKVLKRLLDDPDVPINCEKLKSRMTGDGTAAAVARLEALVGTDTEQTNPVTSRTC